MSTSQFRDAIQVRVTSDGVTGVGEGAPIVRYHENAEDGAKAIAAITPALQTANLWHSQKLMEQVSKAMPGQFAAKAALELALLDHSGSRRIEPSSFAALGRHDCKSALPDRDWVVGAEGLRCWL